MIYQISDINPKVFYLLIILFLFVILFLISDYSLMYLTGTSMDPVVKNHDIVLLHENPKPSEVEIGDNVLIPGEKFPILHKVKYKNNKEVITKGINRSYNDQPTKTRKVKAESVYVIHIPQILKEYITPYIMADSYEELEKIHSKS